jgi:hypothetical protein
MHRMTNHGRRDREAATWQERGPLQMVVTAMEHTSARNGRVSAVRRTDERVTYAGDVGEVVLAHRDSIRIRQ